MIGAQLPRMEEVELTRHDDMTARRDGLPTFYGLRITFKPVS